MTKPEINKFYKKRRETNDKVYMYSVQTDDQDRCIDLYREEIHLFVA